MVSYLKWYLVYFDALKDNIREAIDEIQLHTIDSVLKNWTDRVGCQPRQPFK